MTRSKHTGEASARTVVVASIVTALITATATILATGKWNSLSDFIGLKPNSKNMARALRVEATKKQMVFKVFQALNKDGLCELNGNFVWLYGLTGVGDGDYWTGTVYSAGVHQYDAQSGRKTVRAYATSLELALDNSDW